MASAFNPQSVISDVNVAAPDFGLLGKALMSVQNRYIQGFNQYKSILTSKLNIPIYSEDNKKFREEYFKKIDGYLNNLQGVDFSNPANVSVANELMEPLVKDPEFVADVNFSMMQGAEKRKLDQIRMSTDPKVQSQYSPILERAMNYNFLDMQNAKRGDGSIMKVGVQRYIPFTNLVNVLDESAKKGDLKMDRPPVVTGQWIIKDKFGNEAIPSLTHWARQQLGDTYDEQLLVTAKVKVREQMDNIMNADPNMTKEQAFQEVAKLNSTGIYQNFQEYKSSLSGGIQAIDKQISDIKSRMENRIPKGSQEEQYIAGLKRLKQEYQREIADSSANQMTKDEELQTAFNRFMQNPEYALLPLYKDNLAKEWATNYAQTHTERDIEVNQYGIKEVEFRNAVRLRAIDFELDKQMKEIDFNNELFLRMFGGKGSKGDGKGGSGGGMAAQTTPISPGQKQTADPMGDYNRLIANNREEMFNSYFSKEVLEVASSTNDLAANNVPYDRLRTSLEVFFNSYNKPNHGANFAATPVYRQAAVDVLSYVKSVFPNADQKFLSQVSPAVVLSVIENGVTKRYSGSKDINSREGKKYDAAVKALEAGVGRVEEYMDLSANLRTKVSSLNEDQKKLLNMQEFENSEAIIFKDPSKDDAKHQQLKQYLFENIGMFDFKNPTQTVSGLNLPEVDAKDFDFTAWGQAFQNAEYIVDGVTDTEGKTKVKPSSDMANTMRTLFGSGGANLEPFFTTGANLFMTTMGGKQYLKLELNVKSDEKGENKLAAQGITSGTIGLLIPYDSAKDMWQGGYQEMTPYGKPVYTSRYGALPDAVKNLFAYKSPIRWLDTGLTRGKKATFPSTYTVAYGIDAGYVAFSSESNTAPMILSITDSSRKDNKTVSDYIPIPMGGTMVPLTKGMYESNPTTYGELIDQVIRRWLSQYKTEKTKKVTSDAALHRVNYEQNPDNFTTVDDIPVA